MSESFCASFNFTRGEDHTHVAIVIALVPSVKQVPSAEFPERKVCTQPGWPICFVFVRNESQAWWLAPINLAFGIWKQKLHEILSRKERKKERRQGGWMQAGKQEEGGMEERE